MLSEKILTEAPLDTGGDYFFQQDNASFHIFRVSHSWFEVNIKKPLFKLWGILVISIARNIQM